MMRFGYASVFFGCSIALLISANATSEISVFSVKPTTFSLSLVANKTVAFATYSDAVDHISNFGQFSVTTSSNFADGIQAYGAGFAEGFLTAERTYQHFNNMKCQVDCSGIAPKEVKEFFFQQDLWVRSEIKKNSNSDFWAYVSTLVDQFDGFVEGYSQSEFGRKNPLDLWAFTMVNAIGDLFDIIPAVTSTRRPDFASMSHKDIRSYMNKNGHCSALIQIADDFSDVYVGHSSWFVYSAMLRIYKTYNFGYNNPSMKSASMSFSSYPGTLSSLDDFYLMPGSQLIMTQTTNNIFNASLWDQITPASLFAWQRVRAANQLASSGPEWLEVVRQHNSGTYNNQYMILDAKLFKPGNALQPNTLFAIEQIPSLVVGKDATAELERGYWSSYNVPYHREIYELSGYPAVDAKAGHLSYTEYQQAPRAQIFRRDHGSVKDLETMKRVMRSNDFQTDPLSGGSAWGAICARGDLDASPYAGGGYDTKVVSVTQFQKEGGVGSAWIVNGPTSQGQAAFSWAKSGFSDSHLGQPDLFDFKFEEVPVLLA